MALRVRVCALTEVADDAMRAFAVEGVTWPVIVTRIAGELIAFPGVCPHDDVGLWTGELDGHTVVCPGHGYSFDLHTGRCRHAPALHLRRYTITVVAGEIWVDLL